MTLLYLSNFFNHHQKPLADALFSMLGDDYCFVETWGGIPEEQQKLGYHNYSVPYVKKYSEAKDEIDFLILDADVVIFGEAPISLIKGRISAGRLTIRDDESRYKNPNRYLKWPIYTYNSLYYNKGHLLCASAYAPFDYMLSGMNPKKCYRWGYFPEVKRIESIKDFLNKRREKHSAKISILWVGRLIPLKHPEAFIYVAENLKCEGIAFTMNIIGTGKMESKMKERVNKKSLTNEINFLGSMSPEAVRSYMEDADIFLFTSDRREGWGAVLNESMSSGCAVVADNNIGSVPFLIEDGVNGLIYKSRKFGDLLNKVKWLVNHPDEMQRMGEKAYITMSEKWNGKAAANNLLLLCEALLKGEDTPILEGPCSKAPLLMRKWHGIIKTL